MAESSAGDFTVGKIQKTRLQRVAKMYGQQKRNIIHMSSTAYEQDHSAAAPPMRVMKSRRFIRSPRRRARATVGGISMPSVR
jgi:ribosome maturation protein Sdo1